MSENSTSLHIILHTQQGGKWSDTRRATAGLAAANSMECNNAGGHYSPFPQGVTLSHRCSVATLDRGIAIDREPRPGMTTQEDSEHAK